MPELKDYPYETRLNVLCAALEVIDEKALGGWPSLKCGWPIRASFARVGVFVSWSQRRDMNPIRHWVVPSPKGTRNSGETRPSAEALGYPKIQTNKKRAGTRPNHNSRPLGTFPSSPSRVRAVMMP